MVRVMTTLVDVMTSRREGQETLRISDSVAIMNSAFLGEFTTQKVSPPKTRIQTAAAIAWTYTS
jgi:hypothetical protein